MILTVIVANSIRNTFRTHEIQFHCRYTAMSFITRLFSRYSKERKLGEGAFGEVWLVEHKQTRRQYAMKVFKANEASVAGLHSMIKYRKHYPIIHIH